MIRHIVLTFLGCLLNFSLASTLHAQSVTSAVPLPLPLPLNPPSKAINNPVKVEALMQAAKNNDASGMIAALLTDVDVGIRDANFPHNTALHWAAWENADKSLALLLQQKNIAVDTLNGVDETPLMIAALKGNLTVMRQLLKAEAYPNKTGWTPLHYAATNGHIEAMQLLLDAYSYIDAESPNKTTPLMMAAYSKKIEAVRFLLNAGADSRPVNASGWDAARFAESVQAAEIASVLREHAQGLQAK